MPRPSASAYGPLPSIAKTTSGASPSPLSSTASKSSPKAPTTFPRTTCSDGPAPPRRGRCWQRPGLRTTTWSACGAVASIRPIHSMTPATNSVFSSAGLMFACAVYDMDDVAWVATMKAEIAETETDPPSRLHRHRLRQQRKRSRDRRLVYRTNGFKIPLRPSVSRNDPADRRGTVPDVLYWLPRPLRRWDV